MSTEDSGGGDLFIEWSKEPNRVCRARREILTSPGYDSSIHTPLESWETGIALWLQDSLSTKVINTLSSVGI